MTYRQGKHIDEHIDEMRAIANRLVEYSYPKVSRRSEFDVDVLKQRQIVVDGYDLLVHFGKADYGKCHVEALEVVGVYIPFLPMYMVCKVAAKFLGGHELKYAESFKKGRKVYIWTVALDNRGRPIPLTNPELEKATYEDFGYSYVAHELLG